MQLWDFLVSYTGLPFAELAPLVVVTSDALGNFSFPTWNVPGATRPSAEAIAAALAAAPPLALLQAETAAAVQAASNAVTVQIMPDQTHFAALLNAAAIVAGNGGSAPSSGPYAAPFAALATAYGASSAAAFAGLIAVGQEQSLLLAAATQTALAATAAATTATQIATALTSFETALAAVVTALNAVIPVPVVAPSAIEITGVNA